MDVGHLLARLSELSEDDRDHFQETFESQVAKGAAWIGTPDEIIDSITSYEREVDGFESASLQVNFGMIGVSEAETSMRLLPAR